ncbi:MAG: P1 family peptidase [Alphaproteobacteria bacterium]|nr:P1 family peptidase [Alphaproteobacteria bacterium]
MTPALHRNLITDIEGIAVGNADDATICSGVTVILPPPGSTAAVDVRGGGAGTQETDVLSLDGSIEEAHAVVLSGGSAFGLAAAAGVRDWLASKGIGFPVREARVPIVAEAILFDLLNGGQKDALSDAYVRLARQACLAASQEGFALGSAGAGYGAATANLRGGLGSASADLADGLKVAALVAANPVGTVTMGTTPHFWAHPFERNGEFGGLGPPAAWSAPVSPPLLKIRVGESTTIAVVATNAVLDKRAARRLAILAQTGLARAIHPVHTPLDGDVVFALATNKIPLKEPLGDLAVLGSAAADALARAIARAVYAAAPTPTGWVGPPAYTERFPNPA